MMIMMKMMKMIRRVRGDELWQQLQPASQPASQPVSGRTDACIRFALYHNHHQFLPDHLLISRSVINSQAHLVWRQEILESASADG